MRSALERILPTPLRLAVSALLLAILLAGPVLAAPAAGTPSAQEVSAAVETLKHDPNLVSTRKVKILRWVRGPRKVPQELDTPAWMQPFIRFFAWLAEISRILVWFACAVVVAVLATYLPRLLSKRPQKFDPDPLAAPTHVQDLDIRPESLPEDVGVASRALWERGEHRAALALAYRACLSRLVHVFAIPVQDSTTEGECIELADRHLEANKASYVALLIRVWQRAVYRGEHPSPETVIPLFDSFRTTLDPPPGSAAPEGPEA